jgi:hypothetical protein
MNLHKQSPPGGEEDAAAAEAAIAVSLLLLTTIDRTSHVKKVRFILGAFQLSQ